MEENKTLNNNEPLAEVKVTKEDLKKVFIRSFFDMATINYERFQALGFLYAITPAIKRLYKTKEEISSAMKRHLEMYNSHPWMINPILGTVIALEEKNANGAKTENAINSIKVGLMGPFAGIGDSIFWGTLRPILGGIGAAIALEQKSVFGAILFFILWNILNFGFRYWSLNYGYKFGNVMLKDMKKSNIIQKLSEGSAVLGLMVLGVLVAQWINIKTGIVFGSGESAIDLQKVLDGVVPSLLPLLSTLVIVQVLRKKVTPNKIIIAIFIISFIIALIGHFTGVNIITA